MTTQVKHFAIDRFLMGLGSGFLGISQHSWMVGLGVFFLAVALYPWMEFPDAR